MTKGMAIAGVVGAALVLAVPATAQSPYKRIAQKGASGDFAIAIAAGTAQNPRGIAAKAIATPRQSVDINWTMVCAHGTGAGSKKGSYSISSPMLRTLKMPTSRPDSCTVSVGGSLARGGKIKVQIFKR
jgi:hypothetical protein